MNLKNTSILLVILLLFSLNIYAGGPNDWTTYHSDNDIKIEYQYTNCEYQEFFNQEFVILQITNYTNKDLTVKWNNETWYDKKCINCSDKENAEAQSEIFVKANDIVLGNCSDQNGLRIFSKFSEKIEDMPGIKKIVKLTKFKLKNINISYE